MMLVLSAVALLDSVQRLLTHRRTQQCAFGAIDCSFAVLFGKRQDGKVGVEVDGQLIHVAGARELKDDLEAAIGEFLTRDETIRLCNEAEAGDLRRAFDSFRQFVVG